MRLPELRELLLQQVSAFNRFEGLSPSTMAPNVESAFYALNGTLRERMRRAGTVVEATAEALHDIAQLYRRADGQV
ncbi:hypothetical protein [Actinokineospora sp.]|uniref:hypothetical protein n=1 Tax=Actinokineospora sp. TaxID=1872133 RepID=UPI00403792C2